MSIIERNKYFDRHNMEIRPFFYPIHKHQHLSSFEYNITEEEINKSEKMNQEIIMLPSYPSLLYENDNFNRIIIAIQSLWTS